MSLEQFKTQVLLLHSEQSTLDELSAGISDRYTVHCATSGSEALNTLGDIRIDVIVTSQSLPGMSGLDALREAKKRSPDTIGILLAGNEGDGIEALVGDQEVFQIVRGNVTRKSLKALIEGAARQARLIALAESANDTTANVDVPMGEHIVMETSENGSAIISDGTGRMPRLDPKKISEAADIGARAVDVLVLTKDEEFLATVRESARGLHNVIYTNTINQADEAIRKHKIGVAVIDAAMVGSNVEKLTMHLRLATPRLVAIVAGRRDDGEMLMDLINRGKVYRFLLKPVSPGRSRLAIEASVKHHLEAPDSTFAAAGKPKKFVPKAEAKPAAKPAPKPAPKPVAKPAPKPVAKPAPKPVAKPAPKPVAKAAPKPAPKPAAKPAPKPAPKAKESREPPPKPAAVAKKPVPIRPVAKPKIAATRQAAVVPNPKQALSPIGNRPGKKPAGNGTSLLKKIVGAVKIIARFIVGTVALFGKLLGAIRQLSAASSGGSLIAKLKLLTIGALVLTAVTAGLYWKYIGFNNPLTVEESTAGAPPIFETETVLSAAAPAEVEPSDSELLDQTLGLAETALLEGRMDDASAALERAAAASPDNQRLPFLQAQLAQLQLRDQRRDQRIDEVLAKANERLNENRLVAPSNDNARYYFELARSSDPKNEAARQGLLIVAGKLILQARKQIDEGNFDIAEAQLADARGLDPSNSDLATSTEALQAARERQVQQQHAAALSLAEEASAMRAETIPVVEEPAAAKLPVEPVVVAQETVDEPVLITPEDTAAAEQQEIIEDAVQDPVSLPVVPAAPVPVSSLNRTKYVAPRYPRAAQRRSISGWVDVVLTVDIDGAVIEVVVRNSDPGTTFVDSAIKAVEGWEFEPIIENGIAVQKRATVRMMFALE